MSNRDKIRSKTVGAKKFFEKQLISFTVDGETVEVEVRQPTVEQRGLIFDSAGSVDPKDPKKVKIDFAKLQVNSAIACCFEPGTEDRVFEEADRESLLSQPAAKGGWFDEVAKASVSMLNVDIDDAKKP